MAVAVAIGMVMGVSEDEGVGVRACVGMGVGVGVGVGVNVGIRSAITECRLEGTLPAGRCARDYRRCDNQQNKRAVAARMS